MATTEPTTPTEPDDPTEGNPEPPGQDREAARYRRQLRDTEAERDHLAVQLDAARIHLVETALPAEVVAKLFWTVATDDDLAATVDEHGMVDLEAVAALAEQIRTDHGLPQAPRRPTPDPNQGNRGQEPAGTPTWSDALAGGRR